MQLRKHKEGLLFLFFLAEYTQSNKKDSNDKQKDPLSNNFALESKSNVRLRKIVPLGSRRVFDFVRVTIVSIFRVVETKFGSTIFPILRILGEDVWGYRSMGCAKLGEGNDIPSFAGQLCRYGSMPTHGGVNGARFLCTRLLRWLKL